MEQYLSNLRKIVGLGLLLSVSTPSYAQWTPIRLAEEVTELAEPGKRTRYEMMNDKEILKGVQYVIDGLPLAEGNDGYVELPEEDLSVKLYGLIYTDVGKKGPSEGDEILYTIGLRNENGDSELDILDVLSEYKDSRHMKYKANGDENWTMVEKSGQIDGFLLYRKLVIKAVAEETKKQNELKVYNALQEIQANK